MKAYMERIKQACQVATLACIFLGIEVVGREFSPSGESSVTWDLIRIQGKDVGFSKTIRRKGQIDHAAKPSTSFETSVETHLLVHRFNQVVAQRLAVTSISTADGRLHVLTTVIGTHDQDEVETIGIVKDGELALKFTSQGAATQQKIPWKSETKAPTAVEDSLRDRPPSENETRNFTMFVPVYNQLAAVTLIVGDEEPVELLTESARLRRVSSTMRFSSGVSVETQLWIDQRGEIIKSRTEGLQQETYRCDEVRAHMALQGQGFDLESFSVVKAKGMPRDLASKTEVTYQVRHMHKDPASIFPSDQRQQVHGINPRTARIRIVQTERSARDRFTQDDLAANTLLQTGDPRVRSLAAAAAPEDATPAELARALTSFVHQKMVVQSTSQGFASAADVATSLSGDCTEYAVLLAAICRVREIPSRVVVGLVYSKSTESFGYHMWTEAWVESNDGHDGWMGLDATQPDGRIGLGHLKIATTNLKGTSPYKVFLPLTQTLGQIGLEVVTTQ